MFLWTPALNSVELLRNIDMEYEIINFNFCDVG